LKHPRNTGQTEIHALLSCWATPRKVSASDSVTSFSPNDSYKPLFHEGLRPKIHMTLTSHPPDSSPSAAPGEWRAKNAVPGQLQGNGYGVFMQGWPTATGPHRPGKALRSCAESTIRWPILPLGI